MASTATKSREGGARTGRVVKRQPGSRPDRLARFDDGPYQFFKDTQEGVDRWGLRRDRKIGCGPDLARACPAYLDESCPGMRNKPGGRPARSYPDYMQAGCTLDCHLCGGGGISKTWGVSMRQGNNAYRKAFFDELGGNVRLHERMVDGWPQLDGFDFEGLNYWPTVEWGARNWLLDMELPALATTAKTATWGGRRDIRYRLGNHCVPLDTQILTKRGWLRHDEVRVGDDTIGFDPETGKSQWTRINAVHHPGIEQVERWSGRGWSARCTAEHAWMWRSPRGKFARVPIGAVDSGAFVLAAPFEGVVRSRITAREAAIVAWIFTDGTVRTDRRFHEPRIYQKKPDGVDAIDRLLQDVPHSRYERGDYGWVWTLRAAYAHDLWRRAGLAYDDPRGSLVALLLELDRSALESFMEAAHLAEGDVERPRLFQNEGATLDVLALGAYLLGRRPSVNPLNNADSLGSNRCNAIALTNPVKHRVYLERSALGSEEVWCVTTGLGTWTMRQDGQISLTGNSGLLITNGLTKDDHLDEVWQHRRSHVQFLKRSRVDIACTLEYCLPLDTEILTRDGWKTWDQVRIGDETIGYNPEKGHSEWTRITAVNTFDDAELVEVGAGGGSQAWSARCTPAHRWLVEKRLSPKYGWSEPIFRAASELRHSDRVMLSAPFHGDTPGIPPVEAAVLGWLFADGTIRRGPAAPTASWYGVKRTSGRDAFDAVIAQSKPRGIAEIDRLLAGIPHSRAERVYDVWKRTEWTLKTAWIRDVWARARIDELGLQGFVLSLTYPALRAFVKAVVEADGDPSAAMPIIYQNPGELAEAFRLAIYLLGFRPNTTPTDRGKNIFTLRGCLPGTFAGQRECRPTGRGPVWCPTTELGTWTMRQPNAGICLTGNSDYGQYQTLMALYNTARIFEMAERYIDAGIPHVCLDIPTARQAEWYLDEWWAFIERCNVSMVSCSWQQFAGKELTQELMWSAKTIHEHVPKHIPIIVFGLTTLDRMLLIHKLMPGRRLVFSEVNSMAASAFFSMKPDGRTAPAGFEKEHVFRWNVAFTQWQADKARAVAERWPRERHPRPPKLQKATAEMKAAATARRAAKKAEKAEKRKGAREAKQAAKRGEEPEEKPEAPPMWTNGPMGWRKVMAEVATPRSDA